MVRPVGGAARRREPAHRPGGEGVRRTPAGALRPSASERSGMDRLTVQACVSCDPVQLTGTSLDELLGDDRVDGVHVVRFLRWVLLVGGCGPECHYGPRWWSVLSGPCDGPGERPWRHGR